MKAQLKNLEIEYWLSGKKNPETILFVHGLGANLSQFKLQQEYFQEKFRVLTINLRGHGNSKLTHEYTSSDFKLSVMCNDIIELLDRLNIDKVHYVGNSMGGNIGYEVLKTKPQILKSFTTFGTTGQLNTSRFTLGMMKLTYKIFSLRVIGKMSKLAGQTKGAKEKIEEMISQLNKSTILAILPNLANFNYLDVIKASSIPTMIIKGGKDKDINKALKNTITEFENRGDFVLSKIDEVGHFANLDNPDLFNETLENFLLNIKQ